MIIYNGLGETDIKDGSAVCIGNFDGLHLGHRLIIAVTKKEASAKGLKSAILTFAPHPVKFFGGSLELISTPKKRLEKFLSMETDYLITADFNEKLSSLAPEDFFKNILVDKLRAKLIIVGKEYKFGKNQSGNTDTLYELGKKYGTDCVFLDKLKDGNGIDISSSRIRELIKTGNPAEAACFLNEPYSLEGIVIHGDKLGRKLGFPTINIKTVNEVIPLNGVYAAKVKINGILYGAMAYIGNRPAIAGKRELRIEANIFDFSGDVYGTDAEIFFYEYIRGDMKFASLNDLINNMKDDKNKAVKILGNL